MAKRYKITVEPRLPSPQTLGIIERLDSVQQQLAEADGALVKMPVLAAGDAGLVATLADDAIRSLILAVNDLADAVAVTNNLRIDLDAEEESDE